MAIPQSKLTQTESRRPKAVNRETAIGAGFRPPRRRFCNRLYGALESFVRGLVENYLKTISRLSGKITLLPNAIVENHTALSINYLLNVKEKKANSGDTVELVVSRLAKCLACSDDFELNTNAFLMKGQNVNRDRIRQTAKELGVTVAPKRLIKTTAASNYFSIHDASVLSAQSDELAQAQFAAVDAVTEARNLIAHGVAELIQIKKPQVIFEYLEEISAYCEALTSIFEQEAVLHAITRGFVAALPPPIAVYGDNIVCFSLDHGRIRSGDVLVLMLNDSMEPLRSGKIDSLQVDGVDRTEVIGKEGIKIAIKVSFRVKQTPGYFVLSDAAKQIIFP